MILADSSIWIDHIRKRDDAFAEILDAGRIIVHPFVIGEMALGHMRNRALIVENLRKLPQAVSARDEEVLLMIEGEALSGTGIGYIDAHLLAAVRLTPGSTLWTRDKRLRDVAMRLGLTPELP